MFEGDAPLATSLWTASNEGDLQRMALLVERRGVNVDICDDAGYTPLLYAVRAQRVEAVRFLLQHGANVNTRTPATAASPLHRASYLGNKTLIRMLVDAGADRQSRDSDGMTPLDSVLVSSPAVVHAPSRKQHIMTISNRGNFIGYLY